MTGKDYYKILGVSEGASEEAIKLSYRELAKKYHPDKHAGDKQAEARFKEISEAYAVLRDSKKRQQYDQMRKYGLGSGGMGSGFGGAGYNFDLSDLFGGAKSRGRRSRGADSNMDELFGFGGLGDLFSQIFGADARYGQAQQKTAQTRNIRSSLSVPFKTAAIGGKVVFNINKAVSCHGCKGTGAKGGNVTVCPDCSGSGMVSMSRGTFAVNRPCPRCLGKGKIIGEACLTCGGRGHLQQDKKYAVNLEPGSKSGKKIRLRGQGNPGNNGVPAGDMILTLKVAKHRFFKNRGLDIYCEVPIDEKKAKKGTKLRIKTVYGNTVELNIPGNTDAGRTFRLKGMGIKGKERTGDQFVKIQIK
jgi:molecular chaperone DnaJ